MTNNGHCGSAPIYSQGAVQSTHDGDIAIVRIGRWEGGRYVVSHEARVRVRTLVRDAGIASVSPKRIAARMASFVLISDGAGCLRDTWTRDLFDLRLATLMHDLMAVHYATLESVV